jgi:hypothetical protein
MRSAQPDATRRAHAEAAWWIAFGLIVLVFVTYRDAGGCGFVNLDDDAYVEQQPLVNQGLRPAAIAWAFSAAHSGIWHPLTTLSHLIDCTIFGVRAAPMHWENVTWHALNAVLVFAALRLLAGALWRAAAVAALFALHPLGVESVAWIAERKNLLSTFFLLLGLAAYARFARTVRGRPMPRSLWRWRSHCSRSRWLSPFPPCCSCSTGGRWAAGRR